MSLSSPPPATESSYLVSVGLEDVLRRVQALAPLDDPVLITGETGTGKEVVARLIHDYSRRSGQMIGVNCAAISETLAGAELFGHEKGAFTGAHQRRRGYLQEAENGTLLLDEIGDLSREVQAALLRALETCEFFPVGSARPVPTNARIIAATNKEVSDVDKGFRSDLYHRFPFRIVLPPLRERPRQALYSFVAFFMDQLRDTMGYEKRLSPEAISALEEYSWPGNVRELAHVLKRAFVFSPGTLISGDDIYKEIPGKSSGEGDAHPALIIQESSDTSGVPDAVFLDEKLPSLTLDGVREFGYKNYRDRTELSLFELVMRECRGNKARAADVLGMKHSTFYKSLVVLRKRTGGFSDGTEKDGE